MKRYLFSLCLLLLLLLFPGCTPENMESSVPSSTSPASLPLGNENSLLPAESLSSSSTPQGIPDITYQTVEESVYATEDVMIRKTPDTLQDALGILLQGERIHRTGIGDNGWSQVDFNGQTAYIKSEYLSTQTLPLPENTSPTLSSANTEPEKPQQSFAASLNAAMQTNQIITVVATGTYARVALHEKDTNGLWREVLAADGYVGSQGVGPGSEYASYTPEGSYTLGMAFGIMPNPGTALPYTQVDQSHYWVDDVSSAYYNRFVSTRDVTPDWNSAEHLIEASTSYRYAIAINYNTACIPGAGSAIFLHCSNGAPTMGCVSIPESSMIAILNRISPSARIVIGTESSIFYY